MANTRRNWDEKCPYCKTKQQTIYHKFESHDYSNQFSMQCEICQEWFGVDVTTEPVFEVITAGQRWADMHCRRPEFSEEERIWHWEVREPGVLGFHVLPADVYRRLNQTSGSRREMLEALDIAVSEAIKAGEVTLE